jgi:hypothetical protein
MIPTLIKTNSPVLGSNPYTLGQQPEFDGVFGQEDSIQSSNPL